MAVYNEKPKIIRKSILSILRQSHDNLEFIIVDDSDKIDTIEVLRKLSMDKRIKLIQRGVRNGFIKSLNIGLELCRGEYIARMDGDDISHKDRLKHQIFFLENHKNVSLVGSQIMIIDEN